jgi:hypothetical protein
MRRVLPALLLLTGCPAPDGPTFYQDVVPVVAQHCASCHQEGGVGGFDALDYPTMAVFAREGAARAADRTMPPFHMDADGSCNEWDHSLWLSDAEIATLQEWADAGTKEGEFVEPAPPPLPDSLDGDTTVVSVPPEYEPMAGDDPSLPGDDYQCFMLDLGLTETRFVTGYEVTPDNTTILHHAVGFLVDLDRVVTGVGGIEITNRTILQGLENEDPRPGWNCLGTPGENVIPKGAPISWAPGQGAVEFPAGTGIEVGPSDVLVLQMHYNFEYGSGLDFSSVKLRFEDAVERHASFDLVDPFLFTAFDANPAELPPGEEDATYTWDARLDWYAGVAGWGDVEVLAMLPHMHQRGRWMDIDFDIDGDERCGGRVRRWDFNWQRVFWLEEGIPAQSNDVVRVTCGWDTRGETEPVPPGFGTDAEMCLLGLYIAER